MAHLQGAIGPVGTLTISNINAAPDGMCRSVVAVNGQHPGPLIQARKGDEFRMTVVNNLDDPTMLRQTSVHWHGLFSHGAPWADGSHGVTQCPIPQFGQSFTYAFTDESASGTFWYHSHFGTQYCDGLRGPIVIYDPNDHYKHLYDVDDESTVITLADWYDVPTPSLQRSKRAPNATLINGKGRRPGGTHTDIAVVNVVPGKRYRFRLVSMSCDPGYKFSIDNHDLTIIEADGHLTLPLKVQEIEILTGQRYSFILEANQPPDNYWIRARPDSGYAHLGRYSSGGINSAILRYAGAAPLEPKSSAFKNPVQLREEDLHPLVNPMAPGGSEPADEVISLTLTKETNGDYTVNGVKWTNPDSPVMVQIMHGIPPSELLPSGYVRTLPRNKVIEVLVPALGTSTSHPFHLHGHYFSVIKSANSSVKNYLNPVRRDVVGTGVGNDSVIIRFTTDNPGPWFFHCHMEFHLVSGLAMVFVEAPSELRKMRPPASWDALCPAYSSLPASATGIERVSPGSGQ
ncbi:laccase 9 [Coprinopsis marcescibilis]|uniref:Laccase 9 n=1 Tax=Coprinopsis marcescibilis TaxID=230819 RepID=A0A5C3KNY2_COPMA|nr:laccase 9 [Coprinopsis marcescibilis]